jgi:hypothetical protein
VTMKIEKILSEIAGIQDTATITGFNFITRVAASYNAFYFVSLKP